MYQYERVENPLLRSLADQATHRSTGDFGITVVGGVDLNKFAELILQECMDICKDTSADYLKHRKASSDFTDKHIYAEGEAACDIVCYKIKKRFDIKNGN